MMRRTMKWPILGFCAALLSACGSSGVETDGLGVAAGILRGELGRTPAPAVVTEAQIATALAESPLPLALVALEKTGSQSLVREVGRNGRHATFANAKRQAVILRDGMLTSTRGLGGDLMSSETTALERLVRARQSGNAAVVLRFLDGADQPVVLRLTCAVRPGDRMPMTAGATRTTVTAVTARCTGDAQDITNTYLVAPDGYVPGARQWGGPVIGNIDTQILRR